MVIMKVMNQDLLSLSLYKLISKHPNPKNIYASKLIAESLMTDEEIKNIESDYRSKLEDQLQDSKKSEKTRITDFMSDEWAGFERVDQMNWGTMIKPVDTTYPRIKLDKIAEEFLVYPLIKNL